MKLANRKKRVDPARNGIRVGIIAPASVIPREELETGVARLRTALGADAVEIHPQVFKQHRFWAGTETERLEGFLEYAYSDDINVLWYARGGYGSARLLAGLERFTRAHGKPARKVLVGFSDATALFGFVRERWGWKTLHAPMPATHYFVEMPDAEFSGVLSWAGYLHNPKRTPRPDALEYAVHAVRAAGNAGTIKKTAPLTAELVGGNLTVLASLLGTPHFPKSRGKIIFLEDTDEALYRLDRTVQTLAQSGAFKGARALVLGTFNQCKDGVLKGRAGPVRAGLPAERTIHEIFAELGQVLRIPVVYGLPIGHGAEQKPLILGARYRLTPTRLTLV